MMKWISVKEKLPELYKPVLVYGGTEYHPCKHTHVVQSFFMANCNVFVCDRDDTYWRVTLGGPTTAPPTAINGSEAEQ